MKLETVERYWCQECEEVSEETAGAKLYECSECSEKFNSNNGGGKNGNMCPSCLNKFGKKQADDSCAACEAGEVEVIDLFVCPFNCGEEGDGTEFTEEEKVHNHMLGKHGDELVEFYLARA